MVKDDRQLKDETIRPGTERIWAAYPDAMAVVGLREKNGSKIVTLETADGERYDESVSRFTYINFKPERGTEQTLATTDFLRVTVTSGQRSIAKICDDGDGALVQALVQPYYERDHDLVLADGITYRIRCREVTSEAEYDAVRWLNRFHYRNLNLWGRSSAITVRIIDGMSDVHVGYVGYIMLNSAPLLTRPRDILLGWDKAGRLNHVDRVVRIARVVVHPEFRGLGIGRILVSAAIEYSQAHWNAAGKKPWLLETIAEMSKYHPVFSLGGMFQFGNTAGRDDVYVKPASELDHEMGPGHWRSSLDRMKMVASTPKPYFAAILDSCPDGIRDQMLERKRYAEHESLHPGPTRLPKLQPPLIRFLRATLAYGETPASLPIERHAGNSAMVEDASPDGLGVSEVVPVLARTMSVVDDLLDLGLAESTCAQMPELSTSWHDVKSSLQACRDSLDQNIQQGTSLTRRMHRLDSDFRHLTGSAAAACTALAVKGEILLGALDESIQAIVCSGANDNALWRDLSAFRNRIAGFLLLMSAPGATQRQKEISSAFGVNLHTQEHEILRDFSLDILPGQVVLLVGASGSGKTSVLRAIMGAPLVTAGKLNSSELATRVGILDLDFPPDVSVIDLVGADTAEACKILNSAGISEAKLYLKRRHELSHGQRYRVAAAILAASGRSVWLADEFCAFLDPMTATIVSSGMSRLARDLGATFIASVADGSRISNALTPDVTVRLLYGGRPCPDARLNYWKSLDAWCEQTCGDKSPTLLQESTRERDLIYHIMTTEYALAPSSTREQMAVRLQELLTDRTSEWTDTTLRRQIKLRLSLRESLDNTR